MVLLYILLAAYIVAINFYSFLLVKGLRDKEKAAETAKQAQPLIDASADAKQPIVPSQERYLGKLCIAGALGGAITIYVCMFIFKYKRTDLLLMVLMPLLGVLNVYLFVLLFKSGFGFLLIR
jgi:uncharacterized membrane protein YsdA (DUF1294 family)